MSLASKQAFDEAGSFEIDETQWALFAKEAGNDIAVGFCYI